MKLRACTRCCAQINVSANKCQNSTDLNELWNPEHAQKPTIKDERFLTDPYLCRDCEKFMVQNSQHLSERFACIENNRG